MADYYPLLAKAVAGLPQSTPESRRAIYERARKALLGQLRSIQPPVPDADVDRESQALDDAIAQIERELIPAAPPPAPELPPIPEPPAVPPPIEIPPNGKSLPPDADSATIVMVDKPDIAASASEAPAVESRPKDRPSIRPAATFAPGAAVGAGERPAIRAIPPIPPRPPIAPKGPRIPAPIKIPEPVIDEAASPAAAPAPIDMTPPAEDIAAPPPIDMPDVAAKPEQVRPAAPQPKKERSSSLRYAILAIVVLVIVAGVAALAYKLRDKPEDILRSRPPQAADQTPDQPNKIVERIGAGQAPTTPSRPATSPPPQTAQANPPPEQPGIPVAQRAAILVDAPDDPQKFKTFVGNAVWRLDNVSRGPGQPLTQAVRAEVDIPDAKMKVTLLLQRNADENLPASHTMTIRFVPAADSPLPQVDEIDLPQLRNEVSPSVDSLFGVQAKIMQGMFLVGLTREPNMLILNVEMLKMRGWIDIPMRLTDGHIAKITIEKGPAGDRIMTDAFTAWGQ